MLIDFSNARGNSSARTYIERPKQNAGSTAILLQIGMFYFVCMLIVFLRVGMVADTPGIICYRFSIVDDSSTCIITEKKTQSSEILLTIKFFGNYRKSRKALRVVVAVALRGPFFL